MNGFKSQEFLQFSADRYQQKVERLFTATDALRTCTAEEKEELKRLLDSDFEKFVWALLNLNVPKDVKYTAIHTTKVMTLTPANRVEKLINTWNLLNENK